MTVAVVKSWLAGNKPYVKGDLCTVFVCLCSSWC